MREVLQAAKLPFEKSTFCTFTFPQRRKTMTLFCARVSYRKKSLDSTLRRKLQFSLVYPPQPRNNWATMFSEKRGKRRNNIFWSEKNWNFWLEFWGKNRSTAYSSSISIAVKTGLVKQSRSSVAAKSSNNLSDMRFLKMFRRKTKTVKKFGIFFGKI